MGDGDGDEDKRRSLLRTDLRVAQRGDRNQSNLTDHLFFDLFSSSPLMSRGLQDFPATTGSHSIACFCGSIWKIDPFCSERTDFSLSPWIALRREVARSRSSSVPSPDLVTCQVRAASMDSSTTSSAQFRRRSTWEESGRPPLGNK